MTARRMDISSLLCHDDPPPSPNKQNANHTQRPPSPPVNDPVILAPHLRGKHAQQQSLATTATTTATGHKYSPDGREQGPPLTLQPASASRRTPSNGAEYPRSSSRKHKHMAQFHPEHNDVAPEFTRQHSSSSSSGSQGYTERPRTIDSLLHHPQGHTRPPPPSQISPAEHYSRPSSSHSPTSVTSLFNYPMPYPPDSQSPSSSIASYSPTVPRDPHQSTINLNPNVTPSHPIRRPTESPIAAYQSSRPSLPTSRPSPLTLPHTFSRSSPEVHTQSPQHRALSSTFTHPYSPTEMAQHRHMSSSGYIAASMSPTGAVPLPGGHAMSSSSSSTLASAQAKQRSPFLGLEALVHAASEERRRISGGSNTSGTNPSTGTAERDRERERDLARERERERERDHESYGHAHGHGGTHSNTSPVLDRERPTAESARHHSHPFAHAPVAAGYAAAGYSSHPGMHSYQQPQPQLPHQSRSHRDSYSSQTSPLHHRPSTSFEDEARPHKRRRDSRSPSHSHSPSRSPEIVVGPSHGRVEGTSPRVGRVADTRGTDHHAPSSASATNDYATARRHAHAHVESPSSLMSMRSAPGVMIGGSVRDIHVVAPAPVLASFRPPSPYASGSYAPPAPPQQVSQPHAFSPHVSSQYVQSHHHREPQAPTTNQSHRSLPHRQTQNQSPHHQHSPQHSHHQPHVQPQPVQTVPPHLQHPSQADSMPPSYGYGPKMAGGVGVLRHDEPVMRRELPSSSREGLGLRYEASREQTIYDPSREQARYEAARENVLQAPVPRLARAVWDDEDAGVGAVDAQVSVLLPRVQEQTQIRQASPPAQVVERSRKRESGEHEVMRVREEVELQPPPQHQPLRVWEERAPVPEVARRVSPPREVDVDAGRTLESVGTKQEEDEREPELDEKPKVEDQEVASRVDIVEEQVSPPLAIPRSVSPSQPPAPARSPTPPPVHQLPVNPSPSPPPAEPIDAPALMPEPISAPSPPSPPPVSQPSPPALLELPPPIKAEPDPPLARDPPPRSPSLPRSPQRLAEPAPTPPPVPDLLQLEHPKPEPSSAPVGRSRSISRTPPLPLPSDLAPETEVEPVQTRVEEMQKAAVVHDAVMADTPAQEPEPEPTPAPLPELELEVAPEVQPKLEPSQSESRGRSRSPSKTPLPALAPIKEEPKFLLDDVPIPMSDDFYPSPHRSPEPAPEPEPEPEREQSVAGSSMMDVDEELLSLVETRALVPAPAVPAKLKAQAKSKSGSPFTFGRGGGAARGSSEAPDSSSSAQPLSRVPPIIADEEMDRASMPPPAPRTKKAEKADKEKGGSAAASKKKKDGTAKPPAKPKQPAKPRAKPAAKTKTKPGAADTSARESSSKGALAPKGATSATARSRSTSVMPGGDGKEDAVPDADADDSDQEDDKLYCVCKTRYDEDRVMIACDRCDEWYHTVCVSMPDQEIDLVDQFICPPCVQKHPHLQTTWKRRCLFGLKHDNPSSPSACHKPSRGAFSKYCSDECGVKYMQSRIAHWEKSGGTRDLLWDTVKSAEKREGVVVHAKTSGINAHSKMDAAGDLASTSERKRDPPDAVAKRKAEREVARLNARLEQVVKEREMMKREMDVVLWREKVVDLAAERAERVEECGWDQRLCFGEEEWADFGAEVLESYEEDRTKAELGDDAMQVDDTPPSPGEWWCTGKKKCERHAGWQKLRNAEVSFDKETKEGLLLKLTTREREIRKGIEDILYPQSNTTSQAPSKPLHTGPQINGTSKSRPNGDVSERGKKKKS